MNWLNINLTLRILVWDWHKCVLFLCVLPNHFCFLVMMSNIFGDDVLLERDNSNLRNMRIGSFLDQRSFLFQILHLFLNLLKVLFWTLLLKIGLLSHIVGYFDRSRRLSIVCFRDYLNLWLIILNNHYAILIIFSLQLHNLMFVWSPLRFAHRPGFRLTSLHSSRLRYLLHHCSQRLCHRQIPFT